MGRFSEQKILDVFKKTVTEFYVDLYLNIDYMHTKRSRLHALIIIKLNGKCT